MHADRNLALLARDELRAVCLQLEYLRPELAFADLRVQHTIVVFASTRLLDPKLARDRLAAAEVAARGGGNDLGIERAQVGTVAVCRQPPPRVRSSRTVSTPVSSTAAGASGTGRWSHRRTVHRGLRMWQLASSA